MRKGAYFFCCLKLIQWKLLNWFSKNNNVQVNMTPGMCNHAVNMSATEMAAKYSKNAARDWSPGEGATAPTWQPADGGHCVFWKFIFFWLIPVNHTKWYSKLFSDRTTWVIRSGTQNYFRIESRESYEVVLKIIFGSNQVSHSKRYSKLFFGYIGG